MYDWWSQELRSKQMRHVYSVQGWALLIYLGIMNVAVMLVVFLDVFAAVLSGADLTNLEDRLTAASGWGYFLAMAVGAMWLMLWKKPTFFFGTIWRKGRPMKVGRYFELLSVFMSAQLVMLLLSYLTQWILDALGLQYSSPASISTDSWSMFLYVGLGAPIGEEILFRGLILRSMEPFGKKFAIFASALLFGLFHGNLSQAPFAFCVGLVLGYVALEYNIGWAMVLHMFNNLILSDTLARLGDYLPGDLGERLIWLAIIVFSIAAVFIVILRRKQIAGYLHRERDDPLCGRAFFTAPGIIVLLVVLLLTIAFTELTSISFQIR